MKEPKISQASLDNLKLGAVARYKGKVRVTATLLPPTKEWLAKGGNISERIDEMVRRIVVRELVENPSPPPKELKSVPALGRNKGKIRCTASLLPQTKEWLAQGGNISEMIDDTVRRIIAGELVKPSVDKPS